MNRAEAEILRYSFGERVNHWIAGLSYIYCLLTGLAFWNPYLFWLAALVGGGPVARFWHPILGVMFVASMAVMWRMWASDMRTGEADRAWLAHMGDYVRNRDEQLPPSDRFNAGQKMFFWLMLLCAVLLLLSGIGLWLVDSIPWSLRWLRYTAIWVHVLAGLASIGLFIIHVYMGTAMVRGSFRAMVRGYVSRTWARVHHPLWYERLAR